MEINVTVAKNTSLKKSKNKIKLKLLFIKLIISKSIKIDKFKTIQDQIVINIITKNIRINKIKKK